MGKSLIQKINLFSLAFVFALLGIFNGYSYMLSTGAEVDSANLPAPRQSGNGAAAEKWCEEEGKRLPTLDELKEMYEKREIIGGFTDGFDAGGWPYWSERVTHNPDGKDFGYRIIFGNGADDYVPVSSEALVRKFGEQGEVQYRPFWIKSGSGAYVRCVSK